MLEILGELGKQLQPVTVPDKLNDLPGILTVVDGILLQALPRITWALWKDDRHRAIKNHVHFEALKGVPVQATITEANAGETTRVSANSVVWEAAASNGADSPGSATGAPRAAFQR